MVSIRTTVLGSSLRAGLFSAELTKSSVLISSTLRSSPLASWIRDPLLKLGVVGGVDGAGGSLGVGGTEGLFFLVSGRVRILCFKDPSFPEGTLNFLSFRSDCPGLT